MKKVYVIIIDWHYQGDESVDIACDGKTYANQPQAQKAFKDVVREEKEITWISGYDADNVEIEETSISFSARHKYRDDYTNIYIHEIIIK